MNNFINNYLLFASKTLTIITLFSIIITIFIVLIIKSKQNKNIEIININKKYYILQNLFYSQILNKKDLKQHILLHKKISQTKNKPNIFLLKFNGDIYAKEINQLKEIISILILIAKKDDEILLILNSYGGLVNNYGLAAMQLKRIKNNNIKLTIAIDLIAASGGYLMACVAENIIASHFAIIGSIGVIGQIPNFNKLLNKNLINIEQHTAGEHKRTLTLFGKNTNKGRKKFCESLEETHNLFKNFVKENRPSIPIEKISTGEYWYGKNAIKLNLIDKIQTSEDYLLEKLQTKNIYEIKIKKFVTLTHKIKNYIKFLMHN